MYTGDFRVELQRLCTQELLEITEQCDYGCLPLPTASRFIESILLGIPNGLIWLERKINTLKVHDGRKRLGILHAFYHNHFALVGLESQQFMCCENCTFQQLAGNVQRRIREYEFQVCIIENATPKALTILLNRIQSPMA